MKIFLLEDDQVVAEGIVNFLTGEGFRVTHAATLNEARQASFKDFDVLIFDWNLPDGVSVDLLKELRGRGLGVPVLYLSGRSDVISKVVGLELGADDYMTKPFEPQELGARLKALGRRTQKTSQPVLTVGDIEIRIDEYAVYRAGKKVDLTRKEFDLFRFLVEQSGKVFTRDELLNAIWGFESSPVTRTVDVHIAQLRTKLGEDLVETVRGVGYRVRVGK